MMELNEDIRRFAEEHGCKVDEKILELVTKLGSCPCRIDYVKCPCENSIKELKKTGHCHCGLFKRN